LHVLASDPSRYIFGLTTFIVTTIFYIILLKLFLMNRHALFVKHATPMSDAQPMKMDKER
jgi:hypothetical protein